MFENKITLLYLFGKPDCQGIHDHHVQFSLFSLPEEPVMFKKSEILNMISPSCSKNRKFYT